MRYLWAQQNKQTARGTQQVEYEHCVLAKQSHNLFYPDYIYSVWVYLQIIPVVLHRRHSVNYVLTPAIELPFIALNKT
jgi:hypothetical protein